MDRHTQREGRDRNCSDVTTGQRTPGMAGSPQKLGKDKEGYFSRVVRGSRAYRPLDFRLPAFRTVGD